MTDEMMNLRLIVEKSADGDLLGEMIGFTAQRNGYRDRDRETRTGTVEVRIPGCGRAAISQAF